MTAANQNILSSIDNTRKQIANVISSFWHKNPKIFPSSARTAYSMIAFSNAPLQSLNGQALNNKLDVIVANINSIIGTLAGSENNILITFANNTITPLFKTLTKQIEYYKNNLQQQSSTPKQYNTIDKNVQIKLNKVLVPSGDMLPIKEDGVLGPETMRALVLYRKKFNVAGNNVADVVKNVMNVSASYIMETSSKILLSVAEIYYELVCEGIDIPVIENGSLEFDSFYSFTRGVHSKLSGAQAAAKKYIREGKENVVIMHTPEGRMNKEYWAVGSLKLNKEAKKKEKLDPKAKDRNRGDVCFPAEKSIDKKDHFPINSLTQARNALSQVAKYTKVPSWYKGTLKSLVETVKKKVHGKYPSIKSEKKKS